MTEKLTLRKKIDRSIFMYQVRYLSWKLDVEYKIKRWLYCRKDYHKLRDKYLIVTQTWPRKKKRCIFRSYWFECIICGKLFFATKKEQDKYIRYRNKEEKRRGKLIMMNIERFKEERGIVCK